jgi:hypothetical protein
MPMKGAKAHAARLKRLTSQEAQRQIGKALFAGGQMSRLRRSYQSRAGLSPARTMCLQGPANRGTLGTVPNLVLNGSGTFG